MKKFANNVLTICVFALLILFCNVALCAEKLADNIANIFRSENFIITYQVKENNKLIVDPFQNSLEDITLAKMGNKSIVMYESINKNKKIIDYQINDGVYYYTFYLKDGKYYSGMSTMMGGRKNYASRMPKIIIDEALSSRNGESFMFGSFGHFFYFLTNDFSAVLTEYNKELHFDVVTDRDKENMCYIYNGNGEETIDNILYYYEEFVTPNNYILPAVTRFYFKDNQFVKFIRIDKSVTVDNYNFGGAKIIDIKNISNVVKPEIFEVPKNLKIDSIMG